MPRRLSHTTLAHILLLAVVFIWGATFVLVKDALQDASPLLFNLLRMTLASLALAIVNRRELRRISRKALLAGLAAFAAGPPFALALFLLAAASLCLVITQVIAGTMVQQAIPDALRGRISALGSAGQNGLAGLAAAATAGLAAALGPGRAVTGLAVTTASAGLLLTLLIVRARGRLPAPPVGPTM